MRRVTALLICLLLSTLTPLYSQRQAAASPVPQTQWQYSTLPFTPYLLLENSEERTQEVSHIVIHFISNVVADPANPHAVPDVVDILYRYGVSAHYIIGRDGALYMLVPENYTAFHAGRGYLPGFPHIGSELNQFSIGIELLGIGTFAEMSVFVPITKLHYKRICHSDIGFTDAQYITLNSLISDILTRHPGIEPNRRHIIGHSEYAQGRRTDPGVLFEWARLWVYWAG